MKKRFLFVVSLTFLSGSFAIVVAQVVNKTETVYKNNRAPLKANPYIQLPIGAIQAEGWLKEQLLLMKNGMTGDLDKRYPLVMGKRNGWLGGDGDQWERGPYWLDGLLPLAYILNDTALKNKIKPWIEWSIASQKADGYFGPNKDYPNEDGVQRDNSHDWWPKMVMLKVLQQYYMATSDKRILNLMTNYFRYQLKELPKTKLDHWTFWAAQRGGDNLQVVYWLYNLTGDKFLLNLAEILHKQTVDWAGMMQKGDIFKGYFKLHGVNLAQGIKEPLIYYQQHPEEQYYSAVKKGFEDIRLFHGQPQGLYAADEWLHGTDPTQGSELCTAVEMMFSLEAMLPITGDVSFADHLEKIAFNALPTQSNADYTQRQYYQQPNQVMVTREDRNFNTKHGGTGQVFGLLTGYPCCTANMHQGWPKFTQNIWYATNDGGAAALIYAPSTVNLKVRNGQAVTIKETTNYPFEDKINFAVLTEKSATFPFHVRIPKWCKEAVIRVNGKDYKTATGGSVVVINRTWSNNDKVQLELPMIIEKSRWHENAMTVERGPLVYALKIEEKRNIIDDHDVYGPYTEVQPASPWNFGLISFKNEELTEKYKVIQKTSLASYPWTIKDAPIEIKVPARRLPRWQLYQGNAGPLPYSIQEETRGLPETEVTLIPYGCSTLRISEFPEVR